MFHLLPIRCGLFTHEMFSCLTPSTALLGKVCQYAPMALCGRIACEWFRHCSTAVFVLMQPSR